MAYGDSSIWVGYDDREVLPYAVARHSIKQWTERTIHTHGVVLQDLIDERLYTRPIEKRRVERDGGSVEVLWDTISEAPMSTQFAISRFFILHLAYRMHDRSDGWALFVDCDVLLRNFVDDIFAFAHRNNDKALLCVPHNHNPTEDTKKDAQPQARVNDPRYPGTYSRKNWSSVMLLNRRHPANDNLTIKLLNTVPGRDLHRFCWLRDEDIGFLDVKWNHLVGVEGAQSPDPHLVHFTNGGPWLPQYADVEYADEWRKAYRSYVR